MNWEEAIKVVRNPEAFTVEQVKEANAVFEKKQEEEEGDGPDYYMSEIMYYLHHG